MKLQQFFLLNYTHKQFSFEEVDICQAN